MAALGCWSSKARARTAARRRVVAAQKNIMKNPALFLGLMASLSMLFFSGTLGEARGPDKADAISRTQRKAKLKTLWVPVTKGQFEHWQLKGRDTGKCLLRELPCTLLLAGSRQQRA